ncbi:PAAR domain-containing protein [Stenotrophomonas rhizophila]|uniref:PAAR domain-containing protein n=1 Tax=Stenotrophomonas rhizophila TaxID=216778 RepID=UPI0028AD136E|nr:PAAR domain-containing protein [Stenotrophomonas rhizophila]
MSIAWVVVGDATSGGGEVITGSASTRIDGHAVALVGDKASCPTHGGVSTIVSGDPARRIAGRSVARHMDPLDCGCRLIAGVQSRVSS